MALARLAFFGTPAVAVPPLRALVAAGHDVAVVVTRPDRRRGRRQGPSPSPVKMAAAELGLLVAEDPGAATAAHAELGVVVAYGVILASDLLQRLPMVNLHFSLLPRWRGAAPVERAILAGDAETGVCLMAVVPELDAGPLYDCLRVTIGPHETAAALRNRLTELGAALLVDRLGAGLGQAHPQVGAPTYAAKVSSDELRLSWERPALELERLVRVGRAWTTARGRRLLVLEARARPEAVATGARLPGQLSGALVATGAGQLELVAVQPQGRAPMAAAEWLRGARLPSDEVLGP